MNVASIRPANFNPAPHPSALGGSSFGDALRDADALQSPDARQVEAREAAKSLVASAFVVPLLASVRETSFATGPFAPTMAERRFGPIIDQQIADQIMSGTNFAVVDAVVDRLHAPQSKP